MVRFALWALRIYLLILLTLIGIKFARVFSGSHPQANNAASAAAAAVTTTQPNPQTKP